MKQKNHFLCLEHCSGTRNTKGDLGSLAWKIFAAQPQVVTPEINSAHFTGDSLREAEWAAWHYKELWGRGINRPLRPQETQLYLSSRTAEIHFKAALGAFQKREHTWFSRDSRRNNNNITALQTFWQLLRSHEAWNGKQSGIMFLTVIK